MAAEVQSSSEVVIDSAVGPCHVLTQTLSKVDIDDYVKTSIESQAIYLQFRNLVQTVDPQSAKNRTPVVTGDVSIGGYDGN